MSAPATGPTLRDGLLGQLRHWDDEAFVALANRGLLRRAQKDLEKQPAAIVEESQNDLVLSFAEHRIRFDRRGPGQARCSCPSGGVCQHILAATLWLQRLAIEQSAGAPLPPGDAKWLAPAAAATATPGADAAFALLNTQLLAITASELRRHAGKAGYRWAWQRVVDLEAEDGIRLSGEHHLVIGLRDPRVTLRYMGGGVAGILVEPSTTLRERLQVAAVLAYQRASGVTVEPPEIGQGESLGLDLGKDHSLLATTSEAQRDSRARLRTSVGELLRDGVDLGLSHLSPAIHQRWATLAVWAQGADYPRLALLLRRVADHVEMLLERAGGADEHRLLAELALVHALVTALTVAAAAGSEPRHLVGRARSRYAELGNMELLGLGASAWRSASGYVGLTMMFWSPREQAFFSCTDARPEMQRGFDPVARYRAPGPWSGLGCPADATGRQVILTAAQANAAGRLSAAQATAARVEPASAELLAALPAADRWPTLLAGRASGRRSLLAEPQPLADWAILAPARFGVASFDAVRQTLVWPLWDADGVRLDAELVYAPTAEHAIRRLEQLTADDLPAGTRLVGRLRGGASGVVVEPLSLLRPAGDGGTCALDALHFDPAPTPRPATSPLSAWLDRLRSAVGIGATPSADQGAADEVAGTSQDAAVAGDALPEPLADLRQWLERQAERGLAGERVAPDRAGALRGEWGALARRAASAGLDALPTADTGRPLAELVLTGHYLCQQYARLLDRGDGADR